MFLVLYRRERKVEPVVDATATIAEPFSPPCLIRNSIRDRLVARSPIRQSRPAGAQQSSGLIDIMVHMGTWRKARSECMADHHKCQPSLAGPGISEG